MNELLLLLAVVIGASVVIAGAGYLLSSYVSRWTIRANLLAFTADDQPTERHSLTVSFHALSDRPKAVLDTVAEKRLEGWHYLGAEPVPPLQSLRSWGGALRLQFVSHVSDAPRSC